MRIGHDPIPRPDTCIICWRVPNSQVLSLPRRHFRFGFRREIEPSWGGVENLAQAMCGDASGAGPRRNQSSNSRAQGSIRENGFGRSDCARQAWERRMRCR
jgi:hypothetical protein